MSEYLPIMLGRAEQALHGEDAILQNDTLRLYGVFDGLTGHGSGDIAAQTSRDAMQDYFAAHYPVSKDNAVEVMKEAFQIAGNAIQKATRLAIHKSMATTASVIHFVDETIIVAGHIGDSRIYHLTGFDWREEISWSLSSQLTNDESTKHGLINVLSASSARCDQARLVKLGRYTYDRFVICSDGVSGWEEWPISVSFKEALSLSVAQEAAKQLVKLSQIQDDRSVLVVDYKSK